MMVALYVVPVDVRGVLFKANDRHTVPCTPADDVRVAIRLARPTALQHFQPDPPEIQSRFIFSFLVILVKFKGPLPTSSSIHVCMQGMYGQKQL
eukprot:363978-Chlamydomonas_euryale.AAC.7